jgi:hypothetical protein
MNPCTRLGACVASLLIAHALSGCTIINQMRPSERASRARAEHLQALQLNVMHFADEYVTRTSEALTQVQQATPSPEERLAAQTWKVQQATAAYTIASGPNPVNNALDIVVLASLSRMVFEGSWVVETYGPRAMSLQQTYRSLEPEAWQLLNGILTETQMARLREIMDHWRAKHPDVHDVAYVHFRDFADSVGAPAAGEAQASGNLFSLLGLDPLSGLDPAVREIAQSRQVAERAIYYMQRMPALMDMQVERLAFELAVMPETKTLLGDFNRASLLGSSSDQLVRSLPQLLDHQRDALLTQLTQTLRDESASIGSVAGELRTTLQTGTETAHALQGAAAAIEHLRAQFVTKSEGGAGEQKGRPFDIRDYTDMLREAGVAAGQLSALTGHADALVPVLRAASQDAAARLQHTLDHLFLLLLVLVVIAIVGALLAALVYRRALRP